MEQEVTSDFASELKLRGFRAYEICSDSPVMRNYARKDFFKICLNNGRNIVHYSDKSYDVEGSLLFFGNPHIPYSWETVATSYTGYACLFSESFFRQGERSESLLHSPLFRLDGTPIFRLNDGQRQYVSSLFQRMIEEQATGYAFRDDLIRNFIHLLIHEALKIQPSESLPESRNASSRLTRIFFELLERQFPIENAGQPLRLRTAQDYAGGLSVHVNYLNRSVKETTGKPTTSHINERIVTEARALLQHTDWPVAEIAYSLGFEYPTYFNNFFKRYTGETPTNIRHRKV
ncbi:helix-turn-helix domain-containing protein [Siphonobacter aquaeclarae]|uniref:Transcriptional regulator, AraC family n=1 Tax=Siphonobacter aquaeclarae TaxID=563176 RepID=A0A1G9RA08_9BACT|nr:helix-turn-helix domain-containing protein [Siphonobacter aquaeclarae]SDM19697.1 transcriptional regulator, AraC family [Siphonobacter aquaeclarae]